jgi:Cupin
MGEQPVALEPGDVIVFPSGDAELRMGSVPATPGRYPETVTLGDGVRVTATLVCGFLGYPFNLLLSTLPRRLHLRGLSSAVHIGYVPIAVPGWGVRREDFEKAPGYTYFALARDTVN